MHRQILVTGGIVFFGFLVEGADIGTLKPVARLLTPWSTNVLAGEVHPEYPRPGLVRSDWFSLNGSWNYNISSFSGPHTPERAGTIRVPFPVESYLSGVQTFFSPFEQIKYSKSFTLPKEWAGRRILLHFDGVNWEAKVELNGKRLGVHQGGYDRFTFDITDSLIAGRDQTLTVTVKNPEEHGTQLRGKQVSAPHGIWYTSASGIWQTVWLEPVPDSWVESAKLDSDVDDGTLNVTVAIGGETNKPNLKVEAIVLDHGQEIGRSDGKPGQQFVVAVPNAKLWSPDNPTLYDVKISLSDGGKTLDLVSGYFGMRKINISIDSTGHPRIMLNNQPYFQLGVLDQGYWPDGIYTAPTDEALKSDIQLTKKLGFNMCRKHVKVEPERWYYWCDRLGLLVWQDIPSAGEFVTAMTKEAVWPEPAAREFQCELERIVTQNFNHPSIAIWIAFNEGWGQHDTAQTIKTIKGLDSSRLVIGASGWNDWGGGDVRSLHKYPGPAMPEFKDNRAVVCGECGGLGLTVPEHVWPGVPTWSYRHFNTFEELSDSYSNLLSRIRQGRTAGLSGAVITQLSDVESEINGLITYDRKVIKVGLVEGMFQPWNQ